MNLHSSMSINKLFLIAVTSLLIIFNSVVNLMGQSDNTLVTPVYKKVFIDTDDFDTTYLEQLALILEDYKEYDSTYFSMLNDLAYYTHTQNLPRAYAFTQKGLQISFQQKDSLWNGRFKITQGAILLRMEQLDSAEQVLNEAKLVVSQEDIPFLTTQLGYVYERRGQLDKALDYALESMRLGKELGDTKAIALAYSDLSNLFWKQGKFDVGLKYGLKSVTLFKDVGLNSLDYNFTLFVVGNNLQGLERYADARWYYQQCIKMAEQYGFYNNLSDAYIFESELDIRLGDFDTAKKDGENAVKYAELLDNNFMLMRSWLAIGQAELANNQFFDATKALNKCLEVSGANFSDEYYLNQVYKALGNAYAKMGNYKEGYLAFQKYDSLKDDIFSAETDQRISLLQTQFNTAQQQARIIQQQAEITVQKNGQLLTFVIAGFLLMLLVILFINFRNNKKKNNLLEKQNKEKEFLLKEIHHRVKNNLGVVSSLLALQSEQIEDDKVKDVMLESQNRVNSMSMIHQKLYQGTDLASIEMKDYFLNLGSHVLDSFGLNTRVKLEVDMAQTELDVDTAVPLGLIVNELLTNALKYAFPDSRMGEIIIRFSRDNRNLELLVQDNGVGYDIKSPSQGTGFGSQLINLLVLQLGGKLETQSESGTTVGLKFTLG